MRHVSKFKEEAAAVENMIMEEGTSVNEHSTWNGTEHGHRSSQQRASNRLSQTTF